MLHWFVQCFWTLVCWPWSEFRSKITSWNSAWWISNINWTLHAFIDKTMKTNLSENQFGNIYCELNLFFFHYLDKIGHLFVISISWDGYNPGWVGKNRETLGDYIKSDCKWGYMNDCPTLQLSVGRKWNNELGELPFLWRKKMFPNVLLM